MQHIDLKDYVVHPTTGDWIKNGEYFTPGMLTLAEPTDGVTLAGPLRVRVSVQAQNSFNVIGNSLLSIQKKELFGYLLDIPPGYTWTYPRLPFVLRDVSLGGSPSSPAIASSASAATAVAAPPAAAAALSSALAISDVDRQTLAHILRRLMPGVNDRLIVVIRPAGPDACTDPCAPPVDPCRPPEKDCHCGGCKPCHCHTPGDDIGCNVAVANIPDMGVFFPAACEPCAPGASIGMPTLKGPTLIVPPARGGTVRTRYFNGMFMTSEDLETDQRNVRLKRALMNRALGQGVVWGLNVGLDGDAICVFPGYGVDCCGNDLVVTTPYRVDGQALLRDPAAAALLVSSRQPHFSLVLEYFECPEQPRPVHGDPCAPEVTRCETSRVRETTRLRLAPPCEIDDSGPFKDFLAEIGKLTKDSEIGGLLAQPASSPAPAALALAVPFDVRVDILVEGQPGKKVEIPPKSTNDQEPNLERGDIGIIEEKDFRITLTARPGFEFVAGEALLVRRLDTTVAPPVSTPTSPTPVPFVSDSSHRTWQDKIPLPPLPVPSTAEPIPPGIAYQLQNWRMRHVSGELAALHTEVQLTLMPVADWRATKWGQDHPDVPGNARLMLHIQVLPTAVRAIAQPPSIPCFNDACDPGRPRFPVPPPWLHADPTRPGQAADPRVLVLALLHSWLAIEMARNKPGSQPVAAGRLQVAAGIYQATWKLFFARVPDAQRVQLTDGLQRLLRAWCCALLYPGPTCHCEPHGVVIGCASVSGGHIQSVDPWGGRRWVVHYPLLAYWGQQFGIMPFDALASKIFGFICCIAGLPAPRFPDRPDIVGLAPGLSAGNGGSVIGRASDVNLGRAMLILGTPAEAAARIAELGIPISRVTSVSPVDFVLRFTEALRMETGDAKRPLVHYTVLGLPALHLVAPGDPEPAGPPVPEAEHLRNVVRTTISRRTVRAAVPALLRGFAEDLSLKVVNAIAIEPHGETETAVASRLAPAGVATVGTLLGRSPEELHAVVLKRELAEGLATLIERAESDVAAATKAVCDSILAMTVETDRRLFARADFRTPEAAADLAERLQDKLDTLKLGVTSTNLADLVVEAAGRP
jgi:hypothetical protein